MPTFMAYHITWHTYGTWLPGDERGGVDRRSPEVQCGRTGLRKYAHAPMKKEPVSLTVEQRRIVAAVIRDHCRLRNWVLHAVNVLKTHVHTVITAPVAAETVRSQLKAWSSRRLNEPSGKRDHWWAEIGYDRRIEDEPYFQNVLYYVIEEQEERPLDP